MDVNLKYTALSRFLAVAYFAIVASSATAQQITLEQVLQLVSDSHPQLRQQARLVEESSALVRAAKWQRFPSLSFDYGTSNNNERYSAATVSVPVYEGGAVSLGSGIQSAEKEMREARIDRVRRDLFEEAAGAFFEAIRAERSVVITQRSLGKLNGMRESAVRRVEADVSPAADLDYLDSQIALQRSSLANFQGDQALALSRLKEATGEDLSQQSFGYTARGINGDHRDILTRAYRSSAYRSEIDAKIRKSSLERDKLRAAIKPSVSLNYREQLTSPLFGVDERQVYLSFNFSTGRGLSYGSEVLAGDMRLAATRDEAAAFKKVLVRDVEHKLINIERLSSQIPALEQAVAARTSMLDSYSRLFATGTRSWLDLLNAESEKYQAELDLHSAEVDLKKSEAVLALMLGEYDDQ